MTQAYICDAIRTPIGRYGGTLAAVRADDLGALPLKALMARNPQVDWTAVEDIIYGCANQAGEDNRNVARMSLLLAGLPEAVPGTTIGHVSAFEVNRTARWLSQLTKQRGLPEKLFVLHQFRTSMIEDIGAIGPRAHLAMVQHVDGFGTPGQKLATYDAVARPRQFAMGFKLFYDEDRPRMGSAEVHRLRPDVRFVSFQ